MRNFILFVLAILVVFTTQFSYAVDKEVTFAWNHDSPPELAGFKIHQGTSSKNYDEAKTIDIPLASTNTNCTIEVEEGQYCFMIKIPVPDTGIFPYFFAATAYDTGNLSSLFSNEVTTTFDFEIPPAVNDLLVLVDAATDELTFKWNYDTTWLPKITNWSLWESATSGGPFTKVVDIPYDPNASQPYSTNVAIVVPDGSKVTKYYVLVTHRGAVNNYRFSSNSNEVSVTINKMPPTSPFEFKIKIKN